MVEKVTKLHISKLKNLQWDKMFYMWYLEPVIFVLVFAHSFSGTIMRNQVVYQSCTVVFNYNKTICTELGTKNMSDHAKEIETEMQPYAANLFMIRTLLESIVPAICGVFVGAWSDHYGRRPLLIISMIGFALTHLFTVVICAMSDYYPVNPWYYIIAALPHSILGGNCVFQVAAYCFISDITNMQTRPYRMIFMEVFFFIGLTSGAFLSSFVYAATNATTIFGISASMLIITTIFIIIYVPESLHVRIAEEEKERRELENAEKMNDEKINFDKTLTLDLESQRTDKKDDEKIGNVDDKIKSEKDTKDSKTNDNKSDEKDKPAGLFSWVHIKDMLKTCLRERPYYDRSIIWLITGTMFLSIFVWDGVMTVFYLFVREKFHWDVRDMTFFETVSHMVPLFGTVIGFLILRKVFGLSVVALALLSFFSEIISNIIKGVANETWHLYLAIAFGAFKSIGGPMCRTIVSNIVSATDLGKIFTIKNVLQSIAPFVAAPLYTYIYKKSLTTFPGLFNIVSAALYLIAFVFMLIVLRFKYIHKEHYVKILK